MRILIIRYSALGDVLLTTGIIKYLKEQEPGISVDILTSSLCEEIFRGSSFVEDIYTLKKGASFSEIQNLYRNLPSYDYVFDLQAKPKTQLIKFFTKGTYHKIRNLSLQRRLFVKYRWFQSQLTKNVVEKYAETCLPPLGIKVPSKEALRPFMTAGSPSSLVSGIENYIVIHPYASQKNKVWPFFKELVEKLLDQGEQVVIVGQGSSSWPDKAVDLSNKSSISELASILSTAKKVVTTDSGPMHMSVALGKPTYALFGPTTKEFGFYPDFEGCTVFEDNSLDCRPCHVHGGQSCPFQHFKCMRSLTVDSVIAKL